MKRNDERKPMASAAPPPVVYGTQNPPTTGGRGPPQPALPAGIPPPPFAPGHAVGAFTAFRQRRVLPGALPPPPPPPPHNRNNNNNNNNNNNPAGTIPPPPQRLLSNDPHVRQLLHVVQERDQLMDHMLSTFVRRARAIIAAEDAAEAHKLHDANHNNNKQKQKTTFNRLRGLLGAPPTCSSSLPNEPGLPPVLPSSEQQQQQPQPTVLPSVASSLRDDPEFQPFFAAIEARDRFMDAQLDQIYESLVSRRGRINSLGQSTAAPRQPPEASTAEATNAPVAEQQAALPLPMLQPSFPPETPSQKQQSSPPLQSTPNSLTEGSRSVRDRWNSLKERIVKGGHENLHRDDCTRGSTVQQPKFATAPPPTPTVSNVSTVLAEVSTSLEDGGPLLPHTTEPTDHEPPADAVSSAPAVAVTAVATPAVALLGGTTYISLRDDPEFQPFFAQVARNDAVMNQQLDRIHVNVRQLREHVQQDLSRNGLAPAVGTAPLPRRHVQRLHDQVQGWMSDVIHTAAHDEEQQAAAAVAIPFLSGPEKELEIAREVDWSRMMCYLVCWTLLLALIVCALFVGRVFRLV